MHVHSRKHETVEKKGCNRSPTVLLLLWSGFSVHQALPPLGMLTLNIKVPWSDIPVKIKADPSDFGETVVEKLLHRHRNHHSHMKLTDGHVVLTFREKALNTVQHPFLEDLGVRHGSTLELFVLPTERWLLSQSHPVYQMDRKTYVKIFVRGITLGEASPWTVTIPHIGLYRTAGELKQRVYEEQKSLFETHSPEKTLLRRRDYTILRDSATLEEEKITNAEVLFFLPPKQVQPDSDYASSRVGLLSFTPNEHRIRLLLSVPWSQAWLVKPRVPTAMKLVGLRNELLENVVLKPRRRHLFRRQWTVFLDQRGIVLDEDKTIGELGLENGAYLRFVRPDIPEFEKLALSVWGEDYRPPTGLLATLLASITDKDLGVKRDIKKDPDEDDQWKQEFLLRAIRFPTWKAWQYDRVLLKEAEEKATRTTKSKDAAAT